jgi:hypothetical protein
LGVLGCSVYACHNDPTIHHIEDNGCGITSSDIKQAGGSVVKALGSCIEGRIDSSKDVKIANGVAWCEDTSVRIALPVVARYNGQTYYGSRNPVSKTVTMHDAKAEACKLPPPPIVAGHNDSDYTMNVLIDNDSTDPAGSQAVDANTKTPLHYIGNNTQPALVAVDLAAGR